MDIIHLSAGNTAPLEILFVLLSYAAQLQSKKALRAVNRIVVTFFSRHTVNHLANRWVAAAAHPALIIKQVEYRRSQPGERSELEAVDLSWT